MPPIAMAVITVCSAVVTLAAAAAVAWKVLRFIGRCNDAFDDLAGEPARPGVAARPGVMERLAAIEAELKTNHGTSLRDAVDRVARRAARIEQLFDEHIAAANGNGGPPS